MNSSSSYISKETKNLFILENNKKYKSINLFNNRTLQQEIAILRETLNYKRISLNNNQINKKEKPFRDLIENYTDIRFFSPSIKKSESLKNSEGKVNISGNIFKTLIYEEKADVIKTGCEMSTLSNFIKPKDSKINSIFFNLNRNNLNNLSKSKKNKDEGKNNINKQNSLMQEQTVSKKEVDIIYKNTFDRFKKFKEVKVVKGFQTDVREALERKRKLLKLPVKTDHIFDKMKELRLKLSYIKGVYEYSYPIIMEGKLKGQKKIHGN